MKAGRCEADFCELCPVNQAYGEIFDALEDPLDEGEDDGNDEQKELVQHGYWEPMKAYPNEFVCSECGDLWPDEKAAECPNCHAIMDLEKTE